MIIITGIDDHGNEAIVLGRGTQHGWAANIDIFNSAGQVTVRFCHCCLEWIEIDDYQVNRWYVVLDHDRLILIPARQNATVDFWVQGLDSAIHHLGISGVLGNFHGGNIIRCQ